MLNNQFPIDTRKHTYKNISPAEMLMALRGINIAQATIYAYAPELFEWVTNDLKACHECSVKSSCGRHVGLRAIIAKAKAA